MNTKERSARKIAYNKKVSEQFSATHYTVKETVELLGVSTTTIYQKYIHLLERIKFSGLSFYEKNSVNVLAEQLKESKENNFAPRSIDWREKQKKVSSRITSKIERGKRGAILQLQIKSFSSTHYTRKETLELLNIPEKLFIREYEKRLKPIKVQQAKLYKKELVHELIKELTGKII